MPYKWHRLFYYCKSTLYCGMHFCLHYLQYDSYSAYYASIMLDAFRHLLCSKLCRHNIGWCLINSNHLCISLLSDECFQTRNGSEPTDLQLPDKDSLQAMVEAFKATLSISAEKIQEFECNTRQQRTSSLWYDARRYRLTASL